MPFPKYEDWTPRWEKNGEEFDADKARSLLYSLEKQAHEEKERRQERDSQITTLQGQLQELGKPKDDAKGGGKGAGNSGGLADDPAFKELVGVVTTLATTVAGQQPKKLEGADLELAKLRAAVKVGLSETQAKRLTGSTAEEIEADAKELAKDYGLGGDEGDKGGDTGDGDDVYVGRHGEGYDGPDTDSGGKMPTNLPKVRGDLGRRGGGGSREQIDPAKAAEDLIPSLGS